MHGSSGEFVNPHQVETPGLRNEDFMLQAVRGSGSLVIERATEYEDVVRKTDFKVETPEGERVPVQFKTRELTTQQRLDFIRGGIIPITADETQLNRAKTDSEWRTYVINEFVDQFNDLLPLWREIYYRRGSVTKEDIEEALR